jgi:hypothetical protein
MILSMSLRMVSMVMACLVACGGAPPDTKEPQTAKQKQLQDERASGEADKPNKKWGGWRYQGTRDDCFYVLGRRCFKTQKAACSAAHCKGATSCNVSGGGPATVSCSKS